MLKAHYLAFGLETLGALILLWNGVPLFREVIADPASHEPRSETLIWAFASIALIQVGYWARHWIGVPMPRFSNAFVGEVLLFLSRLNFVFAASVFSFAFLTRRAGFYLPTFRSIVAILVMFSVQCYTRELEHWGSALAEPDNLDFNLVQKMQSGQSSPQKTQSHGARFRAPTSSTKDNVKSTSDL